MQSLEARFDAAQATYQREQEVWNTVETYYDFLLDAETTGERKARLTIGITHFSADFFSLFVEWKDLKLLSLIVSWISDAYEAQEWDLLCNALRFILKLQPQSKVVKHPTMSRIFDIISRLSFSEIAADEPKKIARQLLKGWKKDGIENNTSQTSESHCQTMKSCPAFLTRRTVVKADIPTLKSSLSIAKLGNHAPKTVIWGPANIRNFESEPMTVASDNGFRILERILVFSNNRCNIALPMVDRFGYSVRFKFNQHLPKIIRTRMAFLKLEVNEAYLENLAYGILRLFCPRILLTQFIGMSCNRTEIVYQFSADDSTDVLCLRVIQALSQSFLSILLSSNKAAVLSLGGYNVHVSIIAPNETGLTEAFGQSAIKQVDQPAEFEITSRYTPPENWPLSDQIRTSKAKAFHLRKMMFLGKLSRRMEYEGLTSFRSRDAVGEESVYGAEWGLVKYWGIIGMADVMWWLQEEEAYLSDVGLLD